MIFSRITMRLFGIGVAVMPFTGLPGPSFLGEVRHELSVYFFLAALLVHACGLWAAWRAQGGLIARDSRGPQNLQDPQNSQNLQAGAESLFPPRITGYGGFVGGFLGVVFLSFLINFFDIYETFYQGRWGMEKFISSLALLLYGVSLSFLSYGVAKAEDWGRVLVRPLAVGVGVCALYSLFEVGAWFSEDFAHLYGPISDLVHAGFDPLGWDGRLRSVSFEAPDFASYAGYVWPWMLAAVVGSKGGARLGFLGLFLVLNLMILLSQTRTSLVVVAGLVFVVVALRFVYLPPRLGSRQDVSRRMMTGFFGLVALLGAAAFFYAYDLLVVSVVEGDRVSNISRLASITAALRMFAARPLFGFGFGQFGFHLADYVPSWGLASWEVRSWIADALNAWPGSYSVYARLGADLGVLGILVWVGGWLRLVQRVVLGTLWYQKVSGAMPLFAYPLIAGCFCVLLNGVSSDSLRAPMIWITLGFAARYIQTAHEAVAGRDAKGGKA